MVFNPDAISNFMRAFIVLAIALAALMIVPTVSASDPPTGTRRDGNCAWVYDFPDAGYAVCMGREACPGGFYTKTVTIAGTEERCLL